tara:strand:+ start:16298 stop:16747 length:450 start_codon:yes stop_codon:yes gene_type:complete
MKLKTTVKLRAQADCKSHALVNVEVRDLVQIIDEPTERGGTNLGFTPTDTALSALIGCTNVIGHKCADKLGVDIGNLHIAAVADFDRRGVTLTEEIDVPFERIKLTIISDGSASESDLQRVAVDVAKYCPLAKLFRSAGTEIIEVWKHA